MMMVTGKGCRATVKPQAKKAFSSLIVTNLLALDNISSGNWEVCCLCLF